MSSPPFDPISLTPDLIKEMWQNLEKEKRIVEDLKKKNEILAEKIKSLESQKSLNNNIPQSKTISDLGAENAKAPFMMGLSMKNEYSNRSAELLWNEIKSDFITLKEEYWKHMEDEENSLKIYGPIKTIIQSSGKGKDLQYICILY